MAQMNEQEELMARKGAYKVAGTGAVSNVPHYGFQASAATVIAEWKSYDSQGNEYDMLAYFGITGISINADDVAYIIPPKMRTANKHSFQLTSGAGDLLRKQVTV